MAGESIRVGRGVNKGGEERGGGGSETVRD